MTLLNFAKLILGVPRKVNRIGLCQSIINPQRGYHTSPILRSSFFNLGGLSTSRESRYLAKEKGIPRTEFSPHLELIRSSEVDTQQAPGSVRTSNPSPKGQKQPNISGTPFPPNGFVTISQVSYQEMQDRINSLERRVVQSEAASLQLEHLSQKRNREGMTLGGLCIVLSLAFVYAEDLKERLTPSSLMRASEDGEKNILAVEQSVKQSLPISSEVIWQHNVDEVLLQAPSELVQVANPKQRAYSGLFWAADED
ncbi:MAG: hypothetical protein Q9219_003956 [cf. Caloplaca sp. 3 TL-2023]